VCIPWQYTFLQIHLIYCLTDHISFAGGSLPGALCKYHLILKLIIGYSQYAFDCWT
jgi:hypothetical protein